MSDDKPTDAQLAIESGDLLDVLQDDGNIVRTKARSEPWQLGHGEWVILIEDRTGGYLLTRCTPVKGTV